MYSLPQSYNQTSKSKRCISSNAYIYIIEDFIDEDDDFNDDLVFVTGLMDGKPAIQNLGTKEIILVELNSKRWYDYSEESQL